MVFTKKEFKRGMGSTPQFLKSEWNMAQLDFWRFHQLFDNADELSYLAHNFIGGDPLSTFDDWLGILRVIYNNFRVFMKKDLEQDPIERLIKLTLKNIISLRNNSYSIEELMKVYEQLEGLYQKLLAIKVKMNLTFKWMDEKVDEEVVLENIKEAFER
jgi:hypothetical protein